MEGCHFFSIFMTNKRMHKMKWPSFPPKKILTFGQNFLNPQVDFWWIHDYHLLNMFFSATWIINCFFFLSLCLQSDSITVSFKSSPRNLEIVFFCEFKESKSVKNLFSFVSKTSFFCKQTFFLSSDRCFARSFQ